MKTVKQKIDDLYAAFTEISGSHAFGNAKVIIDIPIDMFRLWVVGMVIPAKSVVQYNGIKWYCATGATAQAHQPPGGAGMDAVYKPYTDSNLKPWIYNEYVESGWQRIDPNGKTYEVYNVGGGALINNLWPPSALPANWKLVN
jgi:hypothetical protein